MKYRVEELILKANLLGLSISKINTYCKHECTLISKEKYIQDIDGEHILYIPDEVERLNGNVDITFTMSLYRISGTIRVIGGQSLQNIQNMFYKCNFKEIDLTNMITDNVRNMNSLFEGCKVEKIRLSNISTMRVMYMQYMFKDCAVKELDLSSFTCEHIDSKNSGTYGMFENASNLQKLDLSNFNLYNYMKSAYAMFNGLGHEIDLKSKDRSVLRAYIFELDRVKHMHKKQLK